MSSTEEKIKEAFLCLYEEKSLEKISVKALTEKAGINRGTFYDHYFDIYDLYNKLESEFIDDTLEMVQKIVMGFSSGDMALVIDYFEPFYKENRQMIDLFFNKRPSTRLQNKMKAQAKENICRYLGLDFEKISNKQKYIMEYVACGQLGLVTYWFTENDPIDLDSMLELMKSINTNGPWTMLQQIIKECD